MFVPIHFERQGAIKTDESIRPNTWRSFVEMVYSLMFFSLQPDDIKEYLGGDDSPSGHIGLNTQLPLLQTFAFFGPTGGFGKLWSSKDPEIVNMANAHIKKMSDLGHQALAMDRWRRMAEGIARGRMNHRVHVKRYPNRPTTVDVFCSVCEHVRVDEFPTWYMKDGRYVIRQQRCEGRCKRKTGKGFAQVQHIPCHPFMETVGIRETRRAVAVKKPTRQRPLSRIARDANARRDAFRAEWLRQRIAEGTLMGDITDLLLDAVTPIPVYQTRANESNMEDNLAVTPINDDNTATQSDQTMEDISNEVLAVNSIDDNNSVNASDIEDADNQSITAAFINDDNSDIEPDQPLYDTEAENIAVTISDDNNTDTEWNESMGDTDNEGIAVPFTDDDVSDTQSHQTMDRADTESIASDKESDTVQEEPLKDIIEDETVGRDTPLGTRVNTIVIDKPSDHEISSLLPAVRALPASLGLKCTGNEPPLKKRCTRKPRHTGIGQRSILTFASRTPE